MYQDENGWTPLSEGLPDEGEACFVWFENKCAYDQRSWCYTKYYADSFCDVDGVTHWRPAFEAPIKQIKQSVSLEIEACLKLCEETIKTLNAALERVKLCQ